MSFLDDPATLVELETGPPAPRGIILRALPIVAVFILLGAIGSAGTWASFTASTDNASSLATGSLVLANTVTGGTGTCESDDDSGLAVNASTCDLYFDIPAQQPGHGPVEGFLTLENVGSIDASSLSVFAPAACTSPAVGDYSGSGSLCDRLQLVIQEYSDDTFTTESNCVYGGGNATTCAFDPALTIDQFVADNGDFASGIAVGDLQVGEPNQRYFRIAVQLDDAPDNNEVQGREANFSLTWRIEQ